MDSMQSIDVHSVLYWAAAIVAAVVVLVLWIVIRKGRKLPGEFVYRASRLSAGNHLLPAQVAITKESVTFYRPQWIGKMEESIHITHVASIKIDTHLFFSDIFIETTGGRDPIVCHGHRKQDAVAIKKTIEQFQSGFYGTAGPKAAT